MLYAKHKLEEIKKALQNLKDATIIKTFDLVLHLNMHINIFIEVEGEVKGSDFYFQNVEVLKGLEHLVTIEERQYEEFDINEIEDPELRAMFSENPINKSEYRLRRRFDLLQESHEELLENWQRPCPIVTFYSYKGGVGRTTALATYASYLAIQKDKKVIILDCDFEAPGLINFFDLPIGKGNKEKEGIVEYLLDKMAFGYASDYYKKIREEQYAYKVDAKFSKKEGGNGEIYVMSAGNLSGRNREDYLEALARIDLSSVENIVNQFKGLFDDLKKAFVLDKNSVILIDSRTGFNDTFGILSLFSDLIVGFFGTNIQSQYGLKYFLEHFALKDKDKGLVAQSFNSAGIISLQVSEHIDNNPNKFDGEQFYETHVFPQLNVLSFVGENKKGADEDFIHLTSKMIGLGAYPAIDELFKAITNNLEKKKPLNNKEEKNIDFSDDKQENNPLTEPINSSTQNVENTFSYEISESVIDTWQTENLSETQLLGLKNLVIDGLTQVYLQSWYAEKQLDEINPKAIYYRPSMMNFFNNRYLVIKGSKGTGKTFLYESFKHNEIVNEFCSICNEKTDNYLFVNIIGLHNSNSRTDFIDANNFDNGSLSNDAEYRRFWAIYICNQILRNENFKAFCLSNSIEPDFPFQSFVIDQTNTTATIFLNIIRNSIAFEKVEQTLTKINSLLSRYDKKLYILFDQLEFLAPNKWSEWIAPLFVYCITYPYKKIIPKFFMRADLYSKHISGFANKNSIETISLEWKKDEIFAYFFKYLLQISPQLKSNFFELVYHYYLPIWGHQKVKNYILKIEDDIIHYQIEADKEILEPLVEVFFGKYAHSTELTNASFGTSYDWFHRNLIDANEQVSLRPFWGLVVASLHLYQRTEISVDILGEEKTYHLYRDSQHHLKQKFNDMSRLCFPILPATFYTYKQVREIAVAQYFNDLANDAGNQALIDFYAFITKYRNRKYQYRFSDWQALIADFIIEKKGSNNFQQSISLTQSSRDNFDKVSGFLEANGIIEKLKHYDENYTNYRFPFLYRGYFQLKTKEND